MRDYLVIGAGSAGCVLAAELARRGAGSVMVLEAGPSEVHPLVAIPMGLVCLMDGKRDWRFQTTPQEHAGNRQIKVPRGKMVGGSGSINSMVWFRGRADDFDNWNIHGWSFSDVEPAFKAVEQRLRPTPLANAHPLTRGLSGIFDETNPTPEKEGADNLWVVDASIMPAVTSANTNAPSMMVGWKGAQFISEDAA